MDGGTIFKMIFRIDFRISGQGVQKCKDLWGLQNRIQPDSNIN